MQRELIYLHGDLLNGRVLTRDEALARYVEAAEPDAAEPPPEVRDMAQQLGDRLYLVDRRPLLAPFLEAAGLRPSFVDEQVGA